MEASSIAAGAACAGAAAAWLAAGVGAWTLKGARQDSRARSRPMVAVELRDHPHADATQILVVRNYGPSIAYDVKVSFDPEIPDPDTPSSSVTPFLKRRYAEPIPALTPGMELDNLWFVGEQEGAGWVNREPMPDRCTARVTYRGSDGPPIEDEFTLDVGVIRQRTYLVSSKSPDERLKKAVKALETIAAALKSS